MSISDRISVLKTVEVNGNLEKDLLSFNLKKSQFSRFIRFRLRSEHIGRPDIVANEIYGDSRYWWILCYFSKIENIFEDMIEGMLIEVPYIEDIQNVLRGKI